VDTIVTPETLQFILGHVAFATHDFECVVDGFPANLRAEHFGHGRFDHDVLIASIQHAGHHVQEGIHRKNSRVHSCDTLAHQFEVRQRALELVTGLDPLRGLISSSLGGTGDTCGQRASTEVEARQCHMESSSFLVQQIFAWNPDIRESNPGLPCAADTGFGSIALKHLDAVHIRGANQCGDLVPFFSGLRVDQALLGHDGEHAG